TVAYGPSDLITSDFNGDGKADLETSGNGSSNTVSVRLGNGNGTFSFNSTINNYNFGASDLTALAVGEFNGDGRQDLLVTGFNNNTAYVLQSLIGEANVAANNNNIADGTTTTSAQNF
ncbi:MAG: FG-GAP repeat domain-containing protein, partial [bacterium]